MTRSRSDFGSVARTTLKYALPLALLVGVSASTGLFWSVARTPRSAVVSTTVCYVALSNDLTPLFGARVSAVAASPECSAPQDRRENSDGAHRMTG